jgi:5-methyltetrahydropteroyltriglutamate--homocysteine methyltransferase
MKRSDERILTTHCGSLARPKELLDLMKGRLSGAAFEAQPYEQAVARAVRENVKAQARAGIDIVTDGEQSKTGFFAYMRERLSGFEPYEGGRERARAIAEKQAFPEYYEEYFKRDAHSLMPRAPLICTGPIAYIGQEDLHRDIENLKSALSGTDVAEAFMPATAPRAYGAANSYYASEDEFVEAFAEALRAEYLAIVDAGFILQVDDPVLTELASGDSPEGKEEIRRQAERYIEVLNHALRGIPEDKVRFHTCYGINEGPRIFDVPMAEIAGLMLKINAGAYSFETANARHEHEWRIWQDIKLPEGKVLIPGVITHTSNIVEHPELVAQRLLNYASLVGRENVIAGADCGFSSQATYAPDVHPTIVWPKFQALAEGARIASAELWRG